MRAGETQGNGGNRDFAVVTVQEAVGRQKIHAWSHCSDVVARRPASTTSAGPGPPSVAPPLDGVQPARIIDLTVPPTRTEDFVADLSALESLAVRNKQLGEVMRIADRFGLGETGGVSMSTSVPLSVVAASHRALTREMGVTTWEELELSIGEDSTMTMDRTIVMLIAGIVAGIGILAGALHIVIGAMIIAPGFQPFARLTLGVINRSGAWQGGLVDAARAYGALTLEATLAALAGSAFGSGVLDGGDDIYLAAGSLIDYWTTITWAGLVVGGVAAICGGILISLNRTVLTAGVMVALALVPTATMVPMALVAGDPALAAGAGLRFLAEVALVLGGTTVVFLVKRRRDGRGSSRCLPAQTRPGHSLPRCTTSSVARAMALGWVSGVWCLLRTTRPRAWW